MDLALNNNLQWLMCHKTNPTHTNKLYMQNLEYVLEKETHKLLWDFAMQTDHLILVRRQDLVIVNNKKKKKRKKENLPNGGLCAPV